MKQLRLRIKKEAWFIALDETRRFEKVKDEEFQKVRGKAVEMFVLGKVKAIPASALQRNVDGYTQLLKYAPQNKHYAKKLAHYQNKLNAKQRKIASFGPRPHASAWDGSYSEVERYLERTLKDPDSLEWEGCTEIYTNDRGWLVGCEYRAKNSFNGYARAAKWFTIRGGQVVNVEPRNAYNF